MVTDKLSIINTALIRTGNNQVIAEGDGTVEWVVASDAYETELPLLITEHNWGFATNVATLERIGASPDSKWAFQYRKPADCLHMISVWGQTDYPIEYDLLDNSVLTDAAMCRVKYVRRPVPEAWPQGFIEILRMRVMSHVYRGLNEDPTEATRMTVAAAAKLDEVRSRLDHEKPIRAPMKSRLLLARQRRRTTYFDRGEP